MAALLHISSVFAGEHLCRSHTSHTSFTCVIFAERKRLSVRASSQAVEERTSTRGRSDKDKPDWTGIAFMCFSRLKSSRYSSNDTSKDMTEKRRVKGALDATAGDALLSRVVNTAIGIKPLFAVMKVVAKQVLKSTAERNGIPWDGAVRELQNTPEVLLLPSVACHCPLFTLEQPRTPLRPHEMCLALLLTVSGQKAEQTLGLYPGVLMQWQMVADIQHQGGDGGQKHGLPGLLHARISCI